MTDTDTELTFRFLDWLTGPYAPVTNRRAPYWAPRPAPCSRQAFLPSHAYHQHDLAPDADLVVVDRNAAWIGAASSARFALNELVHTGPMELHNKTPSPGYYLVEAHPWQVKGIGSPLGAATDMPRRVWVTHATLHQLLGLVASGHWPEARAHDSWISEDGVSCRFTAWAQAVNAERVRWLIARDAEPDNPDREADYQTVKDYYAMAIEMLAGSKDGKEKSKVKRPDWYHTVISQHAATQWRTAWNSWNLGHGPVWMGEKDEIAYHRADFKALLPITKTPMKYDPTGQELGHMKIKREVTGAELA